MFSFITFECFQLFSSIFHSGNTIEIYKFLCLLHRKDNCCTLVKYDEDRALVESCSGLQRCIPGSNFCFVNCVNM